MAILKYIGMVAAIWLSSWVIGYSVMLAQDQAVSPLGAVSGRTGLLLTDDAAIKLIHNSSGDLAHQYVSQLALWSRVVGSDQYEKAVVWVAQKATEFGLEDAQIERFPSDGETHYFEHKSQRSWKVRTGELWLTSPFKLRVTSYAELPISLCRNSTSSHVEAELIDIGSGVAESDYAISVKGKVVLTSSDPAVIVERAVYKEGALGIVSYWNIPEWDRVNRLPGEYPDLVGWRHLPDPRTKPGTFAFMISPRRAAELQQLLRTRNTVRIQAKVDAELVAGTLDLVTALIRGSKYPDEEILVTAHLDEIGADDNASGSASILEMARTLEQLIAQKQIPRPLRTIRFLWVPEFAGSFAWTSRHFHEPAKRIADLNYDEVGGNLQTLNAVLNVSLTPDSVPTYLNAVMESIFTFMNKYNDVNYPAVKDFHIISVNGTRNRLSARMIPFVGGSDSIIYSHLGIPAIFIVAWPENFYHSSKDTPDKLDPTQLHRSVFSGLAALATVAYTDNLHAANLAMLTFAGARQHIGEGDALASQRVIEATAVNLAQSVYLADRIIHHVYLRELDAIRSCKFFARTPPMRQAVEEIALTLAEGEEVSRSQIKELGRKRAEALGATDEYKLSPAEERAARLVPRRNPNQLLLGTGFVFDKLNDGSAVQLKAIQEGLHKAEQDMGLQGETDLRLMGFPDAPAYYADGHRSILDIRDEIAAEYAPVPIEIMELYFRAFEKAGVMTIGAK
jgi:hypothetical protein